MNYYSTRNKNTKVTAAGAIVKGLAPDGGLFVPESFPALCSGCLENMAKMSYNERAEFILSKFLTDFTPEEIKDCVNSAYTKEKFESEEIAPLHSFGDGTYILELWHGPTCAFKDMALQILPHLLTKSSEKEGNENEIAILVATSGDTGKAALEGFCDVPKTKIAVFYPKDGVSKIQKLQMVTQKGENVGVFAVEGNFDDAQNGVKRIFTSDEMEKKLAERGVSLSSANSINWGRLLPQIVYYFSAYADLLKDGEITNGEKINIVVPTGNFGNILAAYYAMKMGLPVKRFICASNENNVLTDFINTGVYNRKREFKTTISPSMDILISSNLERFLFDISGEDSEKISALMAELSKEGKYDVGADMLKKIGAILTGKCCDDKKTVETIKEVFEKYSYVADTHTAVAIAAYNEYKSETGDKTKTVIASTASPYKFSKSVLEAVDSERLCDDEFEIIKSLKEISGLSVPASLAELSEKKVRFTDECKPAEMEDVVLGFLK